MLEIQSTNKGAELTSIKYKGKERLHDAQSFWNRHAPVLFPIVGKVKDGKYSVNSKEYQLSQHGFARDKNFEKLGEHSYILKSDEETLKKYPFEFELYIWYEINDNKLSVNYKVINPSKNEKMYFGIGGHPAFVCDYTSGKYQLEFEKEENEMEINLLASNGIAQLKKEDINSYMINKNILPLKEGLFDNDALILSKIKSQYVKIKEDGKDYLKFNFNGFKYLGLWSKPGKAPFVCLEPWMNTTDCETDTGNLEEKRDIISLEPGKEFACKYEVEFY